MATAARKPRPAVRIVFALVALACAAWLGRVQWVRRQLILEENRAVELQNQAQYAQAVAAYTALLPKVTAEQAQRIRGNLALCYVGMAEEPARPWDEVLELSRKAYELDSDAVTNSAIRKRLEAEK
jgi:phage-related minor tail protein